MYKIKRFAYVDRPYYTKSQRAKAALEAGVAFGALGGILGSVGGKTGAKIGATLGTGAGAYLGLKATSKKSVDEFNKRNKSYHEKTERILSNPSSYLSDIMSYSKVSRQLKEIEDKYGIKLPSELYELAKVNDRFIPIASKWMKDNQRFLPSEIYLIYSEFIGNELKYTKDYNSEGVVILVNNEMADDTFIVWYPESNTYDYDIRQFGKGEYNTLKSILMDHMNLEIDLYNEYKDTITVDILSKYKDFIKSNL